MLRRACTCTDVLAHIQTHLYMLYKHLHTLVHTWRHSRVTGMLTHLEVLVQASVCSQLLTACAHPCARQHTLGHLPARLHALTHTGAHSDTLKPTQTQPHTAAHTLTQGHTHLGHVGHAHTPFGTPAGPLPALARAGAHSQLALRGVPMRGAHPALGGAGARAGGVAGSGRACEASPTGPRTCRALPRLAEPPAPGTGTSTGTAGAPAAAPRRAPHGF